MVGAGIGSRARDGVRVATKRCATLTALIDAIALTAAAGEHSNNNTEPDTLLPAQGFGLSMLGTCDEEMEDVESTDWNRSILSLPSFPSDATPMVTPTPGVPAMSAAQRDRTQLTGVTPVPTTAPAAPMPAVERRTTRRTRQTDARHQ